MRIIEIRVKLTDTTIQADEAEIAENIKDAIYTEEPTAVEDVTYEIRDDYQE